MPNYIHADPKRRITREDLDTMVYSDADAWVKTLTVFLFYFGARISEALAMKATDFSIYKVDGKEYLEVYCPTLKKHKKKGEENPKPPEPRRLYAPIETAYIKPLVDYVKKTSRPRVWPYTRQYARIKIQRVLPKTSPHCFRHNRLDNFAQRGESPFSLQSWAGWSDTRPARSYVQAVDTRKMADRNLR